MKVFKNTIVYFVTTILNQSIPFILIPIITTKMGTVDVGNLSLFNIFNLVFSTVTAFSLNAYLQYIYYREPNNVPKTVFNILAISLISNVLLGIGNLLIFDHIEAYQDFPKYYAWLIPISSFFSLIYFIYLTLLRNKEKALEYGILSVVMTFLNLGLSIYLIYYTDLLWESRAIPAIIVPILMGIVTYNKLYKKNWIDWSLDYRLMKIALIYSLPFLGIVILRQLLDFSDRFVLEYYCGLESVGLYDIGYKIGMLVYVAINSFHLVFVPKIYQKFSELEKEDSNDKRYYIVSMFHLYFVIIILITIGVLLGGKFLFYINYIDSSFQDAIFIYVPISISYFFYSLYTMSGVIIGQTFNNIYNLYVVAVGIVINLVLNYFFVPIYGGVAAAMSTLFTFVVMYIITFILANRMIRLPWFSRKSITNSLSELQVLVKTLKKS